MKELTREEAIGHLRDVLVEAAGDHSLCRVAKEKGLFCGGFAQWKLLELEERYPQIVRSRRRLTRVELEDLADRWQLARQFVFGEDLSCDVQVQEGERRTCKGWDEFDDRELEQFHLDLCGEEIHIR